jgi:hypothetical protein
MFFFFCGFLGPSAGTLLLGFSHCSVSVPVPYGLVGSFEIQSQSQCSGAWLACKTVALGVGWLSVFFTGMLRRCLAMRLSHAVCCAAQMWPLKVFCGTRLLHTQIHGGLIAPCPIVTLIKCAWFLLSFLSRVQLPCSRLSDGFQSGFAGRSVILVASCLRLMLAGRMEQPAGGLQDVWSSRPVACSH